MVSYYIVPTCIFFILFSACRCLYFTSVENFEETLDWKMAIKKIKDLEELVKSQDNRIAALEMGQIPAEWKSQAEIIQKQNDHIVKLEARISHLEAKVEEEKYESIQEEFPKQESESKQNAIVSNGRLIRKSRILLQPSTMAAAESVAFFAYFSSNLLTSGANHFIMAFDTVITNVGNAYHPHSGTFIAPRSGLYVFTWTIRLNLNNRHTTELSVNNKIVNSVHLNPESNMDGTCTGTAVVHVNQGDDVLVRTGSAYNSGFITSDAFGRSSFAGWILQ